MQSTPRQGALFDRHENSPLQSPVVTEFPVSADEADGNEDLPDADAIPAAGDTSDDWAGVQSESDDEYEQRRELFEGEGVGKYLTTIHHLFLSVKSHWGSFAMWYINPHNIALELLHYTFQD